MARHDTDRESQNSLLLIVLNKRRLLGRATKEIQQGTGKQQAGNLRGSFCMATWVWLPRFHGLLHGLGNFNNLGGSMAWGLSLVV